MGTRRRGFLTRSIASTRPRPGTTTTTTSRSRCTKCTCRISRAGTSRRLCTRKYVTSLDARGRERTRDIVDYFRFVLPKRDWENPAGVLRRLLEADAAEGVSIPETIPTRSRTAAVSTKQASFEAQVEREAL